MKLPVCSLLILSFSAFANESLPYRYLPIHEVHWARDGQKYFFTTADHKVFSHDVKTGHNTLIFNHLAVISHSGNFAASAREGGMTLHSLRTGKNSDVDLPFQPGRVSFSEDDRYLLMEHNGLHLFLVEEYIASEAWYLSELREREKAMLPLRSPEVFKSEFLSSVMTTLLSFPSERIQHFGSYLRLDGFSMSPDNRNIILGVYYTHEEFGIETKKSFTASLSFDDSVIDLELKRVEAEKSELQKQWARFRALNEMREVPKKISDEWSNAYRWIDSNRVAIYSHGMGVKVFDLAKSLVVFESQNLGFKIDVTSAGDLLSAFWTVEERGAMSRYVTSEIQVISVENGSKKLSFSSEGIDLEKGMEFSASGDSLLLVSNLPDENGVQNSRPAVIDVSRMSAGAKLKDVQPVFGTPGIKIFSVDLENAEKPAALRVSTPQVTRDGFLLTVKNALVNESNNDYFETSTPNVGDYECELFDTNNKIVPQNQGQTLLTAVQQVLLAPGEKHDFACSLVLPEETKYGDRFTVSIALSGQPWSRNTVVYTVR